MKWINKLLSIFSIGYCRVDIKRLSLETDHIFKVGDKIMFGGNKLYKVTAILKNDLIVKAIK